MKTSRELAENIAQVLDSKKARDIVIMDVEKLTIVTNYFVICSGGSNVQVRSLCDEVEEKLEQMGEKLLRTDGYRESHWIVMDYGHVIAHIFHAQDREYFNIERLWADGDNITRIGG